MGGITVNVFQIAYMPRIYLKYQYKHQQTESPGPNPSPIINNQHTWSSIRRAKILGSSGSRGASRPFSSPAFPFLPQAIDSARASSSHAAAAAVQLRCSAGTLPVAVSCCGNIVCPAPAPSHQRTAPPKSLLFSPAMRCTCAAVAGAGAAAGNGAERASSSGIGCSEGWRGCPPLRDMACAIRRRVCQQVGPAACLSRMLP